MWKYNTIHSTLIISSPNLWRNWLKLKFLKMFTVAVIFNLLKSSWASLSTFYDNQRG